MDVEIDGSHNFQENSHEQDERTTTMTLRSRCDSKMHGHVGSTVEDPLFEIDDVTTIEEDSDSVKKVSRSGQMAIKPSRRTSVQTSQETAMVSSGSVKNGQSQALVPVGGASEDFSDGTEVCQVRGTKRLRIAYEQACAAFGTQRHTKKL